MQVVLPPVPPKKKAMLIFYCIPVSPGYSRLIFASPRNFAVWMDRIIPRWIFHIGQNLILDSDLYLLHVEVTQTYFISLTDKILQLCLQVMWHYTGNIFRFQYYLHVQSCQNSMKDSSIILYMI